MSGGTAAAIIELLALRIMEYVSVKPCSEDRAMAELLYGLLVSGGAFAIVVVARLYAESRWIGLPQRR